MEIPRPEDLKTKSQRQIAEEMSARLRTIHMGKVADVIDGLLAAGKGQIESNVALWRQNSNLQEAMRIAVANLECTHGVGGAIQVACRHRSCCARAILNAALAAEPQP